MASSSAVFLAAFGLLGRNLDMLESCGGMDRLWTLPYKDEGWHYHHYPIAARNGFFWWELDLTCYVLKLLQWVGIIWDLNELSIERRDGARLDTTAVRN